MAEIECITARATRSGPRRCRATVLTALAFAFVPAGAAPSPDFTTAAAAVDGAPLDAAGARHLENVRVPIACGSLRLTGTVVPRRVAGHVREAVFVGTGAIVFDAPDGVERGQLERLTGAARLAEAFGTAVLVAGAPEGLDVLFTGPPGAVPVESTTVAKDVSDAWRHSVARRGQWVRLAQIASLMDPAGQPPVLAAWIRGSRLGDFLYVVDRDSEEAIRIVQLSVDMGAGAAAASTGTATAGPPAGGEMPDSPPAAPGTEDDGDWDSWVAVPRSPAETPAFQVLHTKIDARFAPSTLDLAAKVTLTLAVTRGDRRTVRLLLDRALAIDSVRLGEGGVELPFARDGVAWMVALPDAPAAGSRVVLAAQYHGAVVDEIKGGRRVRDPAMWHPRIGDISRSTFDVTYHWPRQLELVSAGRLFASGTDGDERWERRVMSSPALLFPFAIGDYRVTEERRGHVRIRIALDPASEAVSLAGRAALVNAVAAPLDLYEQRFGPYPLDEMILVAVPGALSQGGPGFIALARGELAGDPRFAIAHEVAHQWWGDLVGWAGERDRWISEALAQYSADAYSRTLPTGPPRPEPWQDRLAAPAAGGRTVEEVGPLVLGRRLASSLDPTGLAYVEVVYGKGTLVIEMLARWCGGDVPFGEALRAVVAGHRDTPLTTASFIAAIAPFAHAPLGTFIERFIEGTGVPDIVYKYQVVRVGFRRWLVHGEARQYAPLRWRTALRRTAGGQLDVVREELLVPPAADATVIVPFAIEVEGPARAGMLVLRGGVTRFEISVDVQPLRLRLDPERSTLARFAGAPDEPKRALVIEGRYAAASGDLRRAEALLVRALQAPLRGPKQTSHFGDRDAGARLDLRARLELAAIYLDQDRVDEARTQLDALRSVQAASGPVGDPLERLAARLEIRHGAPGPAVEALRRRIVPRVTPADPADYALLAIAARAQGDGALLAYATRMATRTGADLSLLTN